MDFEIILCDNASTDGSADGPQVVDLNLWAGDDFGMWQPYLGSVSVGLALDVGPVGLLGELHALVGQADDNFPAIEQIR